MDVVAGAEEDEGGIINDRGMRKRWRTRSRAALNSSKSRVSAAGAQKKASVMGGVAMVVLKRCLCGLDEGDRGCRSDPETADVPGGD